MDFETPGVKGCCVGYKPNFPWQAPSLCTVSHECHFLKFGRGCAFVNLTIARFQRQISPNTFTAENTLSHSSSSRLGGQNLWVKLHRGIGGLKGELSVIFFFRGGSRVPRLQKKERGIGMVTGRIGGKGTFREVSEQNGQSAFHEGECNPNPRPEPPGSLVGESLRLPRGWREGWVWTWGGRGVSNRSFCCPCPFADPPGRCLPWRGCPARELPCPATFGRSGQKAR